MTAKSPMFLRNTVVFMTLANDAPPASRTADRFASDCRVLRHGSAELVALAEARLRADPADPSRYRAILAGLFDQPGGDRIDTIVNACTHFPLVERELRAAAPHPVAFVDGSAGIARRIAFLTEGQAWPVIAPPGLAVFTGGVSDAARLGDALAGHGLTTVETL